MKVYILIRMEVQIAADPKLLIARPLGEKLPN